MRLSFACDRLWPAGPLWRRGQSVDRALSLRGELCYAPTERLVGGGTAACAPPPCPLTLQRSEGPPATKCGREPPTGGVWQRHFPPRPCRCVLRQGADHHNGHMGHLVPTSDTNCQYENVRASLTLGAPEARSILWRNRRRHASSQTPAHATLFPCGSSFLHTIAAPSSHTTASCGSLPEQLPPITLEISFTTDASSYSSHATQQSCTQRRGDYQLRSKSCAQ